MALFDDPIALILRLFEMEDREGRGADCVRFPEGITPTGLPLENGERVFGIYKRKYYFTPVSLIIADNIKTERIQWSNIRHCTSVHGEGKAFSELTLADGRNTRVRVADMATDGRVEFLNSITR